MNTAAAMCGRPRWVVSAEGLAAFEARCAAAPPPKPQRRRRRPEMVDYYKD